MKVIGAGLPRTATATQKLALEMQGIIGGAVQSVQQWWDREKGAAA